AFVPQIFVLIGDWRNSLYLCHLLVISAVARVFYPRFGSAGIVDNLVFLGLATGGAILVSALSFNLFERPIQTLSVQVRKTWFGGGQPSKSAPSDIDSAHIPEKSETS
ncbi:MAG: hypothetical protein AAFR82_06950, partial [Pseudomonadota bacterium]